MNKWIQNGMVGIVLAIPAASVPGLIAQPANQPAFTQIHAIDATDLMVGSKLKDRMVIEPHDVVPVAPVRAAVVG